MNRMQVFSKSKNLIMWYARGAWWTIADFWQWVKEYSTVMFCFAVILIAIFYWIGAFPV